MPIAVKKQEEVKDGNEVYQQSIESKLLQQHQRRGFFVGSTGGGAACAVYFIVHTRTPFVLLV